MGNCCSAAERSDLPASSLSPPVRELSIWGLCPGPPGELLICSEDKSVAVYDVSSTVLTHQWHGHHKGVNRVAYLPHTSLADSCKAQLTGTPAARCVTSAYHLVRVSQVSGSRDTSVRLWNRSATEAVAVLSAHSLPVTGLATMNHHNQICSGSRDCTLCLWDAATAAKVACCEVSQNVVTFMSAVPAEPAVLQTSEDLNLRLWDTRVMQATQMLPQHSNIPVCCDVSPDGMYFATSCNGFDGEGCEVCFWDRRQLKLIWQCSGHQQATKACVFLPTARKHLTLSKCHNQQEHAVAETDSGSVAHSGCSVLGSSWMKSESSPLLASASADGTVKVWQMGQEQPVCTVTSPREADGAMMTCLAVCSSEQCGNGCDAAAESLFAGTFSGHLHSWDVGHLCSSRLGMDEGRGSYVKPA